MRHARSPVALAIIFVINSFQSFAFAQSIDGFSAAKAQEERRIDRRRKRLHHAGTLPPVVVADVIGRDQDGELLARPTEWDEEMHGAAPVIRIHTRRNARPNEVAGVGDRALLRIERSGEWLPVPGAGVSHQDPRCSWTRAMTGRQARSRAAKTMKTLAWS